MHRSFLHKLAASKVLWAAAALLLLYTLGGFLLAPWLIERYVPRYAQEQLGQGATVEQVRINPFLLTLEAHRFRLEGAGEQPTLAFEKLFVDFELSSLFADAWTFSDVRLTSPSLGLRIDREGRFNVAELMARLRDPQARGGDPPALLFKHLVVENGKISLVDLSGAQRASAAVSPVAIELHDFTTLSGARGRYTLSARSDEGSLTAAGELALQPFAAEGKLALRDFALASAWQYFRDTLGITEPQGRLTLSGHYALGEKAPGAIVLTKVQGEVTELRLALPESDAPLLELRAIRLEDGALTLPQRVVTIGALKLSDGTLGAHVAENGTFDWQRLVRDGSAEETPAAEEVTPADARPWQVHLRETAIERVALAYSDRSKPLALDVQAKALDAALELRITAGGGATRVLAENLNATLSSTELAAPDVPPATLASFTVEGGRLDSAERFFGASAISMSAANVELARDADGPAGLLKALMQPGADSARTASEDEPWRVELREIVFDKFALAYRDTGRSPPLVANAQSFKGRLQLEARTGASAQLIANGIELEVESARLATPQRDAPLATLGTFTLSGGRVDTLARAIKANAIRMSGGGIEITRAAEGPRGLLRVLMPEEQVQEKAAPQNASTQSAWTYQIGSISLTEFDAALKDVSMAQAIAYDVHVASIALENVDSASEKPIALKADLRIAGKGTLAGSGTLAQDFSSASADVRAARIPLQPLHPLLTRHAALTLQSGTLSAAARVAYRKGGEPELTAQGRASVAGFQLNEEASGERFIAWRRLVADGVKLALTPNALAIAEIRVVEPGMKLVIAEDRSVNLRSVIRKPPDAQPQPMPSAAVQRTSVPAAVNEDARTPLPFRIDRIRLDNGTLDFADLSLVLPFATRVHELSGALVNVTSEPDERAQIALGGRVADYGEAKAEGSLILREPTEFLDITARFENVQMPALSPYTATFAGRKIAAGKLWLTLEYKIVDTKLAGENRIVLDDFVLGERVKAPGALDLPLDLAVALLKDSDGKISLAVPVSGDVDNPQFDYGKVIRAAIGNAIARVITAPFRALASLFGKGKDAETLRSIEFAAGSDRIAPPEREKLEQLAKALKARPQLKLVMRGPYDPEADAQRLSRERVRAQLAAAMGLRLRPGEHPGPIAFGSADTQKALEALLEAAEPDGLARLASRFKERTGRAPDRINPLLGVFGRASKDLEFYDAVYERLVELDPLPDSAVQVLAGKRVQAMVEALAKGGISRERLQAGGITTVKADKDGSIEAEFALETM